MPRRVRRRTALQSVTLLTSNVNATKNPVKRQCAGFRDSAARHSPAGSPGKSSAQFVVPSPAMSSSRTRHRLPPQLRLPRGPESCAGMAQASNAAHPGDQSADVNESKAHRESIRTDSPKAVSPVFPMPLGFVHRAQRRPRPNLSIALRATTPRSGRCPRPRRSRRAGSACRGRAAPLRDRRAPRSPGA